MTAKPIPPWSILRQPERYVPSAQTDVRKTFERVRRELAAKDDECALTLDDTTEVRR